MVNFARLNLKKTKNPKIFYSKNEETLRYAFCVGYGSHSIC